uniref:DM2 domain-containing protein n=1 Tax=Cuerna arida TaxID=1464854 RepID=A0A1B6FA07_9HEMI
MSSKRVSRKKVEDEAENSVESEEEEEDVEVKGKKRGAAASKKSPKKTKTASSAEESEVSDEVVEDAEEDEAEKPSKSKRGRKKANDGNWKTAKKTTPTKTAAAGGSKPKGGKSAVSKEVTLSKELAVIVGKDRTTRSEVVKQVWAYIKKNNLTDPKNKQFCICNDKMKAVIGEDSFKAFGMMKYLKNHIH